MKKRLAVILVTGIFLAPLAFAEDEIKTTGEQDLAPSLSVSCNFDSSRKSKGDLLKEAEEATAATTGLSRGRRAY